MPELPDLEAFNQNLPKKLSGKKLEKLTTVTHDKCKVPGKEFRKNLEKQELKKIYREGKKLRFAFHNGHILGLHLMLKGRCTCLIK